MRRFTTVGRRWTHFRPPANGTHAGSTRSRTTRCAGRKRVPYHRASAPTPRKQTDPARRTQSQAPPTTRPPSRRRWLGFDEVDAIGSEVLSERLGALALDGSLTTLGYAADHKATTDVTKSDPERGPASRASPGLLSRRPPGLKPGMPWLRPSRWPKRLMLCVA